MKSNVLLIGNYLDPKRYAPAVGVELAAHLRDSGRMVMTVSSYENRLFRLMDMLGTIFGQRQAYHVAQVDVFSGLAFLFAEIACWALRVLRKPYLLTLHGGNLPVFAQRCPGRVKRLLRTAAVVTAPSQYLLEKMQPHCPGLYLLPNPLNLARYPFRLRSQGNPQLVWLRAFHQIYNPSLAPMVVDILKSEFSQVSLMMIGPDKDGSLYATQQITKNLGLVSSISFPGPVAKGDVPSWLNRGDIFLNTTQVDNTPVSVLEALACGLCIVSTNVGGIPYLLEQEHDALLVEPDDAPGMAAAVRRILCEPGLAEKLSRNGRVKAEKHDWSVILPQWEYLLDHLKPPAANHFQERLL